MTFKDGKVVFSETVEQEQNADMLYTAAKSAITDIYRHFCIGKGRHQMADKESHTIIAKGLNNYARRSIIDTKNSIFRSLESKMASVKADTEED